MIRHLPKKISTRLLLSYLVPLIYLSVLGVVALRDARRSFDLQKERALLAQANSVANDSTHYITDAVFNVKSYALMPDRAEYISTYSNSYQPFLSNIDTLFALADDYSAYGQQSYEKSDRRDRKALEQLVVSLANEGKRIDNLSKQIFDRLQTGETAAATELIVALDPDKLELIKEDLDLYFTTELEVVSKQLDVAQRRLRNALIIGTPLAGVVTLVSGFFLSRQVRRQLERIVNVIENNGILVTTSSTQIAASSHQLEASITEQSASTAEITATAKEIAVTAEELTQTATAVVALSEKTATTASSGQQDLEEMALTMQLLVEATATISSKLGQIDSKANNINAVVTTIAKVADQTNLLSLNAAIEAEKAGEYGAGFSVVAREIRRLADQTAIATLDIENIVKEMLSSVSTGVMEMDKFSQTVEKNASNISEISQQMTQIIQQVQSLVPRFERVRAGMQAQADGAQQIRTAMEQLNDGSQQTAESVRDTHQAISQLGEVAQDLQGEVAQLKLAV